MIIADTLHVAALRWMEAWNRKMPRAMRDLFTPDGVYEDTAFKIRAQGQMGIESWVKLSVDHIPNLHCEIEEAFHADDRVAVRWIFSGTPRMLGMTEGTGRSYRVPVITLFQMQEDLIARATDCYNLADLLQQTGLPLGSFPLNDSWRVL